ncbi:MAG TPA: tetratricopeptide repeat protein [Caulobacteraceae bacterium]|nr:tetratricopeptide repeat protein [Caulobacteraceae bacterium]
MVDFIEEVEEKLRAERYLALARVWLPWFLAALACAIIGWLGVWAYRSWEDRNVGAGSVAYDRGLQALSSGDQTGAYEAFAAAARSAPSGYKSLSLMQQGNIRLAAGKDGDAADLYDAAAKAAPDHVIGDLARLKAALALMDSAPYPQLQTRLSPLIGEGKPFSLEAREALAIAKLAAGRTAEARADLSALTLTLGVSDAMKARDEIAIELIDSGQAGLVSQAARAAATLPPVPAPTAQGEPQAPSTTAQPAS